MHRSCALLALTALLLPALALAAKDPPAVTERAVDALTLVSGERLLGMLMDLRETEPVHFAVDREWLKKHAVGVHKKATAAEAQEHRAILQTLRDRLAAWRERRKDEKTLAGFLDRKLAGVDEQLASLEKEEADSQLVIVELPKKAVRRRMAQGAARRRLLGLAWEYRLEQVEEKSAATLAEELKALKIDSAAQPDLSDRIGPLEQDDRQWAAKMALTEFSLLGKPHYQGMGGMLIQAGEGEQPKIEDLLGGMLGEQLGGLLNSGAEKPEAKDATPTATSGADEAGMTGVRITELEQDAERGEVTVRGRFLAKMPNGEWEEVWRHVETADARKSRPEAEARIKNDPQLAEALAALEKLGLGGAQAALDTALKHGAATMEAQQACDRRFGEFLLRSTRRLDGPTGWVDTVAQVPADKKRAESKKTPATGPLAIFERRILPILAAKNSSSCSECHLSGVDLKDYIKEDQAGTFASLRKAGLIDVARPDESKLLAFIARKPAKPSLVNDKIRQEEYAAFQAWIRAAARDKGLWGKDVNSAAPLGSDLPVEVIRHARTDRVLASFLENIWSEAGRCAACHSPDRNQEQVKKHGERVSWIKVDNPEGTLHHMTEQGLIDTAAPEKSLVLLKPTEQVKHGGGQKMVIGDRSYKQFRRFIDDYAAVVNGTYRAADELPPPGDEVSVVSDIWLKLESVPKRFDKLLLQVDLYRWDDVQQQWSASRCATADRAVAGDRELWQNHLTLTAPRGDALADELLKSRLLPAGRYLLRLYVDKEGKLQSQYPYELGKGEFVGQIEITSAWVTGYGSMTTARFPP